MRAASGAGLLGARPIPIDHAVHDPTSPDLRGTSLYRSALGWYSFKGTAWISASAADDPRALQEVSNHEMTHWVLSTATSFGYVQQVLAMAAPTPWEPPIRDAQELLAQFVTASWLPQEAAATCSGLVFFGTEERADRIAALPDAYREALAIFDGFFADRSYEPHDQLRVARAIGARSLQTNIVDWVADRCDRDALTEHLADPRNNPIRRFERIVDFLHDLSDDAVREWAGSFTWQGRELTLSPAAPPAVDGVDFHPSPGPSERRQWADTVLRSVRGPRPADELDWDSLAIRDSSNISFGVHPEAADPRRFSDSESRSWLSKADLVVVQANLLGGRKIIEGFVDPPRILGPDAAVISSYCPGDRGVVRHVLPTRAVHQYFEFISPSATACVDFQSVVSVAADGNPHLWLPREHLTLLSSGDLWVLQGSLAILRLVRREAFAAHLMLTSPSWGFVLVRPAVSGWPIVVHPVVWPEWTVRVSELCAKFDLDLIEDRDSFFTDRHMLVALHRIQRMFTGTPTTAESWAALEAGLLAGTYPHPVVEPLPIVSGSFAVTPGSRVEPVPASR